MLFLLGDPSRTVSISSCERCAPLRVVDIDKDMAITLALSLPSSVFALKDRKVQQVHQNYTSGHRCFLGPEGKSNNI